MGLWTPLRRKSFSPEDAMEVFQFYKQAKRSLSKLWVGYVYHLHREFDEAERIYLEVIQESRDQQVRRAAHELLARLQEDQMQPPSQQALEEVSKLIVPPLPSRATVPVPPARVASPPQTEIPPIAFLESSLPAFLKVTADRLARHMEAVGEREIGREFTQQEFQRIVVQNVQDRLLGQISEVTTEISPDGITGSGVVQIGRLKVPLSCRVGLLVKDQRPTLVIYEVVVNGVAIPEAMRNLIGIQVNRRLNQERYPLRFRDLHLREGSLFMSVELLEVKR